VRDGVRVEIYIICAWCACARRNGATVPMTEAQVCSQRIQGLGETWSRHAQGKGGACASYSAMYQSTTPLYPPLPVGEEEGECD
jgi:hypothetical protein